MDKVCVCYVKFLFAHNVTVISNISVRLRIDDVTPRGDVASVDDVITVEVGIPSSCKQALNEDKNDIDYNENSTYVE